VKSGGSGRSGIRDDPARIVDPVAVDFKPAEDFPADDVGYGFDNIGDVLSITPLLLEKYLNAAEQILDQAIVIVDPPKPTRSQVGAIRANAASTCRGSRWRARSTRRRRSCRR